ncbi:hypothetical protein PRMUPPPA20_24960 [Xylanibacter ruminicola]|uniref:Surface protein n=2 Tax=Xylanibacter ruminicola TaxID=839 RepID=D5EUE2_XYLR2|nr:Ig-like domain-containing protein [Xylanibacter ruminicola]ADE81586.1 surface protein [Xylanibacter ruminicola 23]GJG34387.1 hypothetical protein PRMUPPPA20_24960 [Xylanibacter ruminicola]SEH59955.1 Ig-like domain (group 2) [Xylanibacter ruminicola]
MTKKSISRLLQASLMCCLAVLFTACDDIFASEDNPIPAYLSMSDKPVTLKVGDTYRRKAISVTTAVVEYTSSKTDVATVDNEGLVTAKAEGTTTITATATGYSTGGKKIFLTDSKSYVVTVKPATLPAATITTDPVATAGDILAGSATALVTAGEADGGTMMYQVTETNTQPTTTDGFNATVPTAATLAAGTYYIWYYAKADAQHADSEIAATAIKVTVKAIYLKWDNTMKELVATLMPDTYTTVENASGNVNWAAGTYVVEGNVTINGNITLKGNVELIIKDGAKLTANLINGGQSYSLSIYGQANKTGQLVVNCQNGDAIKYITTLEVHGCQVKSTTSSGNCGGFYGIDTFNVYGGSIDAEYTYTGSNYGYGIHLASNGSMNIYGGDVKAVGKGNSKGITGGTNSNVTVHGGKLWAECAGGKAFNQVTLTKDAGYTSGKIETCDDGTSWTEYTAATTPTTKYVRVGY